MQVASFLWDPAEGAVRDAHAGGESELAVASRPHVRQTFYVLVINNSDIAQTIAGLQPQDGPSLADPDLGISNRSDNLIGDPLGERYVSSATVAPGTSRWLRFRFTSMDCDPDGRETIWGSLPVRIRADGMTRDRDLSFDNIAMTTFGTAKDCPGDR